MKHPIKATALICIGLLTFAVCAAMAQCGGEGDKKAIELLKKSSENMDLIAKKLLPNSKAGKETQSKEKDVIKNFDELIKMIIDAQNDSQCQKAQNPAIGGKKPGDMAIDTPTEPGGKKEGSPDGDAIKKNTGKEWGPLPDQDYDETAKSAEDADYPAGYKELIEQFRRIYKSESKSSAGK